MGQAKRRGTYEQRKEQAITQRKEQQINITDRILLHLQRQQAAFDSMEDWQLEMSKKRYDYYISKARSYHTTRELIRILLGV